MKLLNELEAAELLNCSIHKLQKDRRIGSPIQYRKVGRAVRYALADIEAYLTKQTFSSTSQYGGHNGK
jgi:hypothetical protein